MQTTDPLSKADEAERLFRAGYNCAQAVTCAFCETCGIPPETAAKVSAAFGGGMGRLREVCGTISGALTVLGLKLGSADPKDAESKTRLYGLVQRFAERFRADNGSILCRDLLCLRRRGADDPKPEERTEAYYAGRPCVQLVRYAASLTEESLKEFDKSDIKKVY